MKKYTLAIFDSFSAINKCFIIEAENEIEAIKKAYINSVSDTYKQDAIEWMQDERISNCNTVDDIYNEFINCDIIIGKPIEIV